MIGLVIRLLRLCCGGYLACCFWLIVVAVFVLLRLVFNSVDISLLYSIWCLFD